MGRKANHRHFETGREIRPTKVGGWSGDMVKDPERVEDKEYAVTLCGAAIRTDYKWQYTTTDVQAVTCPACCKKLGAQAMKARDAGAGVLTVIPDKGARGGFRHEQGYKVQLDGETIGYVGFQDHYWRIYKLECHHDDQGQPEIYLPYGPMKADGNSDTRTIQYGVSRDVPMFRSRDAAALGCETFYRAGVIKDGPTLIAEWKADRDEWRRLSAERRAADTERQEQKDHAHEALKSVIDRAERAKILGLTNFEKAGLEIALAAFPKKDDEP